MPNISSKYIEHSLVFLEISTLSSLLDSSIEHTEYPLSFAENVLVYLFENKPPKDVIHWLKFLVIEDFCKPLIKPPNDKNY